MIFKPYPCLCEGSGEDFNCLYETDETYGENDNCDSCICSWKTSGGRRSPKNWKIKFPWIICLILWGLPYLDFDDCRSCKNRKKNRCLITNKEMKIEDYKWRCKNYRYGNKTAFIPVIKMTIMDFKERLKRRKQYNEYLKYVKEQKKLSKRLDKKGRGNG